MAFSLPYWFRGFMPFSFPPAVFWLSYFHSTGGHLAKFCKLRARTKQKKHMQMQGKSWGQFGSGQKVCVAYGLLQNITENRTRGGLESHFKTSEVDPAKDQAWRTRLDHSKPIKTPSRKKKKKKKKANNSLASSLKSLAGGKTLKLQPLYNQVKRVY